MVRPLKTRALRIYRHQQYINSGQKKTERANAQLAMFDWLKDGGIDVGKFGLFLFFLFNSFSQNLVKNVWSGYYHNEVLNERVAIISRAKRSLRPAEW